MDDLLLKGLPRFGGQVKDIDEHRVSLELLNLEKLVF
jgi:hypothetical protein